MTDTAARFWPRVHQGEGCWIWTGARAHGGYGKLRHVGRETLAHRVAWMITQGPIPDGLFVLHHCDNPPCVRPDHLFLGTQGDNVHDCVQKGRNVAPPTGHGPASPRWKGGYPAWHAKRCEKQRTDRRLRTGKGYRSYRASIDRRNEKLREDYRQKGPYYARMMRRNQQRREQKLTRALDLWQFWQTIP